MYFKSYVIIGKGVIVSLPINGSERALNNFIQKNMANLLREVVIQEYTTSSKHYGL